MASYSTFYDNSANLPQPTGLVFGSDSNVLNVISNGAGTPFVKITVNDASGVLFTDTGISTANYFAFNSGDFYISSGSTPNIAKVSSTGVTLPNYRILGVGKTGNGLAFDTNGNLYCASPTDNTIYNITTITPVIFCDTSLNTPAGLAFDASGYLYCCNNGDNSIVQINTSGQVVTRYTDANNIIQPSGIVYSSNDGMLYFINSSLKNICQLNPTTNTVSSYIDSSSNITPRFLAIDSSNYYLYFSSSSTTIYRTDDPVCFNEDTKILCLNHSLEEEYIPIQNLKKGDFVKTYLHGYRKVDLIHQGVLFNNPNKWNQCMYKMGKTEENGLLEDLIVTGGHSILVDEFTETEKEKLNKNGVKEYIYKIDDKYLLFASASDHFVPLTDNEKYNYYHLTLENNGDDKQQFGIWANGILTETTCNDYLLNHT